MIGSYFLYPLCKITNPEHTSQFKLVNNPNLNRINYFLINTTIPVLLYNKLLALRETDEEFDLHGDLVKMMTKKKL